MTKRKGDGPAHAGVRNRKKHKKKRAIALIESIVLLSRGKAGGKEVEAM
jgi:hypothetical protein